MSQAIQPTLPEHTGVFLPHAVVPLSGSTRVQPEIYIDYSVAQGKRTIGAPLSAFIKRDLTTLYPFRRPPAYKNQKNRPNVFYFSSILSHIECESRLESNNLLLVDYGGNVAKLVGQPFAVRWTADKKAKMHIPDFYLETETGERVVLDVKPHFEAEKDDFEIVAAVMPVIASRAGWVYAWVGEPHPILLSNVHWLSAYRRFTLQSKVGSEAILAAIGNQRKPLGAVIQEAGLSLLSLPVLYHLLWTRVLDVDLYTPITRSTLVWRKSPG